MSVCTFVEGPGGKRWFQLLADVDSPGVYALVMSQGTYHGNGCPKEDVSLRLPICLGLASYTDRELRSFAACQFRDSAGMVARVSGEYVWKHICNLWREEKLDIWCRAECHHKRRQGVVLQPSGSLRAKEKAVCNMEASGKRRKLCSFQVGRSIESANASGRSWGSAFGADLGSAGIHQWPTAGPPPALLPQAPRLGLRSAALRAGPAVASLNSSSRAARAHRGDSGRGRCPRVPAPLLGRDLGWPSRIR